MNLKHLITATSIALLPLSAGAATFVVPAVASVTGANTWKSEITLHSTSAHAMSVTLTFHDQAGAAETATITIPSRGTIALDDVVATTFHRPNALGAVEIAVADGDVNRFSVASRTFNILPTGRLGQDIAAISIADAAKSGEVAVIAGPTSATEFRMNAGIYSVDATQVRWELLRADGTVAASKEVTYAAGVQNQFSVAQFFGAALQDNDVVHANVITGSAIFYGSIITQASGDGAFVPQVRNREQSRITFVGVDRDLNGTVDILAHDNVLDTAIESSTFGYPTLFRIVANSDSGEPLTYEIVSSTADAAFLDSNGQIVLAASSALKGILGELRVRVTTNDGQSTVVTIPVKFV